MRRRLVPLLFVLAAASACADATGPFWHDGFFARAYSGTLLLRNDAPAPVHYVALSSGIAPLIELAPPQNWPTIGPKASRTLHYEDVLGYEARTREAIVYWWRSDSSQGHVTVQLP